MSVGPYLQVAADQLRRAAQERLISEAMGGLF